MKRRDPMTDRGRETPSPEHPPVPPRGVEAHRTWASRFGFPDRSPQPSAPGEIPDMPKDFNGLNVKYMKVKKFLEEYDKQGSEIFGSNIAFYSEILKSSKKVELSIENAKNAYHEKIQKL